MQKELYESKRAFRRHKRRLWSRLWNGEVKFLEIVREWWNIRKMAKARARVLVAPKPYAIYRETAKG